jgi:uncharacterized LabA/DUF88 family protein
MIYAYIDGDYLQRRCSFAIRKLWDVDPELDFGAIRDSVNAARLFYYDCIEHTPRAGESLPEFEARVGRKQVLLKNARQSDMCHVRAGTLKQRQKPREVTQKEVDVQLVVDMLTHAARQQLSRVVLLTGDLDFRPAVESLVNSGVVVELLFDPLVTADELIEAADLRRPLNLRNWYGFCSEQFQKKHPLPMQGRDRPPNDAKEIRRGRLDGRLARLLRTNQWSQSVPPSSRPPDSYGVVIEGEPGEMPYSTWGQDLDLLINKFVPLYHPGIEWEEKPDQPEEGPLTAA